jgi:hypothetical protein
MARELFSMTSGSAVTDITITELLNDPPFHRQMVGTVTINGTPKFFTHTYNTNLVDQMDARLRDALHRFNEEHK